MTKFSWASCLVLKLDSKLLSSGPTPTYFTEKQQSWPIIWEDQDDTDLEALKKSLMKLAPWVPQPTGSFFPFCEREGNALGALTKKYGNYHQAMEHYYSQQPEPETQG